MTPYPDQYEPVLLPDRTADDLRYRRHDPIDADTLAIVGEIVDDVARRGDAGLRSQAERLGDLQSGDQLVLEPSDLRRALDACDPTVRGLLERTAARIREFAEAQLHSVRSMAVSVPGGLAGQRVAPLHTAGCYAPAGRYPLPSSVLMTVIPARVAGVDRVVLASPRPPAIMLAAAAVAGADLMLAVGGSQAIGAMAHGTESVPRCDVIVGPGNRWVSAAKQYVAGRVDIDMVAGPSELLVIADEDADPELIAADLIAQAEHDVDAWPALITTSQSLIPVVRRALATQLQDLPTAEVAREALMRGAAVVVQDRHAAFALADAAAAEHVQIMMRNPQEGLERMRRYGALFLGEMAAEVFGDYGIGPNHTLPTAGAARHSAGLSIFHFVRMRTWLSMGSEAAAVSSSTCAPSAGLVGVQAAKDHDVSAFIDDVVLFARLEGLEGHARAAAMRRRFFRTRNAMVM